MLSSVGAIKEMLSQTGEKDDQGPAATTATCHGNSRGKSDRIS